MAQKWASGAQRVWPCAGAVVPDPPCVCLARPFLPGGALSFAPNSRPLENSGLRSRLLRSSGQRLPLRGAASASFTQRARVVSSWGRKVVKKRSPKHLPNHVVTRHGKKKGSNFTAQTCHPRNCRVASYRWALFFVSQNSEWLPPLGRLGDRNFDAGPSRDLNFDLLSWFVKKHQSVSIRKII